MRTMRIIATDIAIPTMIGTQNVLVHIPEVGLEADLLIDTQGKRITIMRGHGILSETDTYNRQDVG